VTTGVVVRGDAFVFAEAVEKQHPDWFTAVTRDVFLQQAERAEAIAAGGNSSGSAVEMMRLGALLGERNGHSGIFSLDSHGVPLRAYPIWSYEFDDVP
jgi:hypothetical protein